MKLSRISMAIAAACGAIASAPALAINASNYSNTDEFTGTTLNIRVSGATAQDNGILGSALQVCNAGTVTRYAISNNFVFFCTPNPAQITVPSGKSQLAIYKYSVGGSAFGVNPINSNTASDGSTLTSTGNQLPFLDLTKIAASCTGTNAVTTTPTFGTLGTYTNVACGNASSALTTAATTYIGVSDVEPAFFGKNTANITAQQSYALIFGVPVSQKIRNALQLQQGLVVGDDTEANMPSLTSAQVVSAYTQPFQTWAGIGVTTGFTDDQIYVARRVDSSGTQKTFEALIARAPNGQAGLKTCAVGTDPFSAPDSGNTTTGDPSSVCNLASGAPLVFAGSGGGDVRACLINHDGNSRGAIGILTTEDKPPVQANSWRFVKVDNITPNQAQTAAGRYRFYVESSLNIRTGGAFATNATLGYGPVVTRLLKDFADPTIITAINGTAQTFGKAGLMALLTRQSPAPAPDYTGASSIVPWSKLVGGVASDNCQAPKAVF